MDIWGYTYRLMRKKMDIIELNFLFQIRQIKDTEKQEKLSKWEIQINEKEMDQLECFFQMR